MNKKIIIIIIVLLALVFFVRVGCLIFGGEKEVVDDFKATSKLWKYDNSDWNKITPEEKRKLALEYLDHYGDDPDKDEGPWHNELSWLISKTDEYYKSGKSDTKVAEAMNAEIRVYNETVKAEKMAKRKEGFKTIKVGMTKTDVDKIMGPPDDQIFENSPELGNVEVWAYPNVDELYTITFKNEKVVKKTKS